MFCACVFCMTGRFRPVTRPLGRPLLKSQSILLEAPRQDLIIHGWTHQQKRPSGSSQVSRQDLIFQR